MSRHYGTLGRGLFDFAPDRPAATCSLKLQRHKLGWLLPYIRHGVSVASLDPGDVAGLQQAEGGGFALDVAAQIEIGDRNHQMGASMMMLGDDAARLQVEF